MQEDKKMWRPLEKMFNEVPGRYDLLNRIITMRLDERWRKLAVQECLKDEPASVLDLCTGTGDLVLRMASSVNGKTKLYALDYSRPMLEVARYKALKKSGKRIPDNQVNGSASPVKRNGFTAIEFVQGDAADMPYKDSAMDAIGIGFAFRNLTYKNPDREVFLAEIHRVLKKEGKFVIVESSQPSSRILRILFRVYLKVFVAGLGGMISGHRGAYRYLAASAMRFYTPEEVRNMLLSTGFSRVEHRALSGGIAGLTVAIK